MMIPLLPIMLAQPSCSLAYVNINNWIGIDVLVLLVTLSAGAAVYAIAGILPNPLQNKLKGAVRIEYTEGFFSVLLIASLVSMAYAGCNLGFALSGLPKGNYQSVFQADTYYIGQLLFVKGTRLAGQLMSQGFALSIDGAISDYILFHISLAAPGVNFLASGSTGPAPAGIVSMNTTGRLYETYMAYSGAYTMFAGFLVVTFGALFILYLLLPIIMALAMNLLVPAAILLRSVSFAGPKLREASNAFIAIGIALYFVLPLSISANQAIVNWLYCQNPGQACNPYLQYVGPYDLNNIPLTVLLTPQTMGAYGYIGANPLSLPVSFFGQAIETGAGGWGSYIKDLAEGLVDLPDQVNSYSVSVAQYVFEGIVLIALDFAITMGFAQGLYKGLNAIPSVLGSSGSFWGGE